MAYTVRPSIMCTCWSFGVHKIYKLCLDCAYCYGNCRQISKYGSSGTRRGVTYLAPCGRRLRSDSEVDHYLIITDSQMTIDLFCFDPDLRTNMEFISQQVGLDISTGNIWFIFYYCISFICWYCFISLHDFCFCFVEVMCNRMMCVVLYFVLLQ